MPRPAIGPLRRELAELRDRQRARLCVCGKSQADGEPRKGVHIFSPRSCAEEREDDLVIQRLELERCPAMHADGDAKPVIVRFNLLSCEEAVCECHGKPDHGGCPTCDSGYFNRHRQPDGSFYFYGQKAQGVLPTAAEPTAATQALEVVPEPHPRAARAPAPVYGDRLADAAANAERNASSWTARQLPGPARDHVIEVCRTDYRQDDGPQLRPLPTTSFCRLCNQHVFGRYCSQCGVETDQ